jgi:N-methylhydantoinase A
VTAEAGGAARIAIDIGGTFTDVVYQDDGGAVRHDKTLSTPDDITVGIVAALEKVGARVSELGMFLHGTTVALNALLQGKTPSIGLITTAGFRDVLEIMRTNRPDMYNLRQQKPAPLVARRFRREISARADARGEELAPVKAAQVGEIAEQFVAAGINDIAVCLLHSYANPAHERRVRELLQASQPSMRVTISSDLTREWREFERTSTTVINAATTPIMSAYLERLEARLGERGFGGRVMIMQSSGGVMPASEARVRSAVTLMSGPVGGVSGAGAVARRLGENASVVTLDIGGTSADVAVIDRGRPVYSNAAQLGGWPILMPSVEIHSIGAGGGSLAFVDAHGGVRVGPESAGSSPGPACYGAGGTRATVTDANLALGRIDGARFLDGAFPLDEAAARDAIKRDVADPLNVSVEQAALGILTVVNSNMARLLRDVLVQRGHDPRVFALLAFGGGGPLHGCAVAREAGLQQVIVPPHASTFSAYGIFSADVRHDTESMFLRPAAICGDHALEGVFAELEARARDALGSGDSSPHEVTRSAAMRYAGQEYTLAVDRGRSGAVADYVGRFHAEHARLYGFERQAVPVEFVKLSVSHTVRTAEHQPASAPAAEAAATGAHSRRIWSAAGATEVPVLDRRSLRAGQHIPSPAVIEEPGSTTYLPAGWAGFVGSNLNLVVERLAERAEGRVAA